MPKLEYNTRKKQRISEEIQQEKEKADKLHTEILELIESEGSFDLIMKKREERNLALLSIETLKSRIDNIGKKTGLEEQSLPKF